MKFKFSILLKKGKSMLINIEDVKKVQLRIAEIKEAEDHPNADKLYVLKIDLGQGEERQLVAGIKKKYEKEALIGKKIVIVSNLQPAVIRGVESQGMLLAASDEENTVVLSPESEVALGSLVR